MREPFLHVLYVHVCVCFVNFIDLEMEIQF